jgi:hypothetical protein
MGEILLPGAEVDRTAFTGSGPHPAAGVTVLTLHTTESGPGSINGVVGTVEAKRSQYNVVAEHRAAARGGRRAIQLVDLNRAARSLRNTSAPGETNKAGTVQVSLIGYAEDPVAGTTADDWRWLGRTVIGPIARIFGIPLVAPLGFPPYPPTRLNPPQYLGRERYRVLPNGTRGVAAHAHWRENSHGDAGDLASPDPRLGGRSPWSLIVEGAGGTTTNPTTPEDPLMGITIAQIEAAASRAATKAVAPLAHAGKAVAARDDRTGRVYVVSGAGKFHAINRDVLAGLAVMGQLRPVDLNRIPVIDGAKFLDPLPDLGTIDAGVDELVDLAAAQAADLNADRRTLIASLEALTGPDALAVDALDDK